MGLYGQKEIDNLWSFSSGIFESMIESRNGREGVSFKFVGNNQEISMNMKIKK